MFEEQEEDLLIPTREPYVPVGYEEDIAPEIPGEALEAPLGPQPDVYAPVGYQEEEEPVAPLTEPLQEPAIIGEGEALPQEDSLYIPAGYTEEEGVQEESLYVPAGYEEEVYIPAGYSERGELGGDRTAQEIRSSPEDMEDIRNYMIARKGRHMAEVPDEELYDAFINHMRFFNVNEVTTIGELRWIRNQGEDGVLTADRAYQIFDSLGNVFTNDGLGGAFDGVADYTRAVLTSPSTYLGGVFGRVAIGSSSRLAVQAAKREIIDQARDSAMRGLTGQAAREAGEQAAQQTISQLARTTAIQQIGAAAVFDAGANSFQDYLYQTTLLEAGTQQDYNMLQTGIAALGGVIGGGVAAAPYLFRGLSGQDFVRTMDVAEARRAEEILEEVLPHIDRAAVRFQDEMSDWMKSVREGQVLSRDSNEVQEHAVRTLLDPQNPSSIPYAMTQAGIGLRKGPDAPGAIHQMISFAKALPVARLNELDASFREATGVAYTEFVDIVAAAESRAGTILGLGSHAARSIAQINAARARADNIIAESAADLGASLRAADEEPVTRHAIQYAQSIWRRALVSHPATTAVNIQGWGQAHAARALAETVHGGILGTAGLVAKLASPVSMKAGKFSDEALKKSQDLFAAQVFKVKNLMNPYETREAFEAILHRAPASVQSRIGKDAFGGVSMDTAARFGMNPDSFIVRNIEKISHKTATMSGVKAQDVYTKSFSMMAELDKLTKQTMGMNLETVMRTGRVPEIPMEAWEKATEVALRDVFSADYTKGSSFFNKFAKLMEDLSNTPFLGFLFPFGRFLNNNLAFVMQYSPIAMFPLLTKMRSRGFFSGDSLEAMSKMIVGTSALAGLIEYQRRKSERGLQWYEEETSTGDIVDRTNLAPASVYMLAGHIGDLYLRGEAVSADLIRSMSDQLGIARITRELGAAGPINEAVDYMLSTFDSEAERVEFSGFLMEIGKVAIGDIGSGFTRPLEPVNVAVGAVRGDDYIPDRRLLRGQEAVTRGFLRYVDNIFDAILEEQAPARHDATQFGPAQEANPVARMFGDRIQPVRTDIDMLLARANIAPWTIQERTGIPEWDAIMNERVTPYLNMVSRQLMETDQWRNANQRTRERLARTLITNAKREIRDLVSTEGTSNEQLRREQQRFLSLPQSLREQAKAAMDIRVDDRDLTGYQIELLRIWIEEQRNYENRVTSR